MNEQRLENIRLRLCSVGLHPRYHDTPEKAVEAVIEMIAYFRAEYEKPSADLCAAVFREYGIEGYAENPKAKIVGL